MDGNLTRPQDQNWTSGLAFCNRTYVVVKLIVDFLFVIYSFSANMIVIVELLRRNFRKRNDRTMNSISLPEVFLLHINFIYICYCAGTLLLLLEQLNVCQVSDYLVNVLFSPGYTAGPLVLVAISVDCYLAVVYPVTYMAIKNSHHRVPLCSMLLWLYAFVVWLIAVIYHLHKHHPIYMLSFYISLPAVGFFSISTLRVLYTHRPGSSRQTPSPAKRRASWIILSILVLMVLFYMPQVSYFTYRFLEPTELVERLKCLEVPLVMVLPTLCNFASPLVFLYWVGKLGITSCPVKT